ncbi:MAG TPA: type IV pilus modification protein PilV [Gammaproteobacteria bacterium]|nr:type IV pilus modification protein PilV [Gammaproteobacteria bacterium]
MQEIIAENGCPRMQGLSMIEILVTVVVLSIGLLGLAGLQLTGLKYNHSAYMRSQATLLASDIIDRMRANRDVAKTGGYDINIGTNAPTATCMGANMNCTPAEMAAADLSEWKQDLQNLLPGGDGSITRVVNGNEVHFTITIQWDDTRGEQPPLQLPVETVL